MLGNSSTFRFKGSDSSMRSPIIAPLLTLVSSLVKPGDVSPIGSLFGCFTFLTDNYPFLEILFELYLAVSSNVRIKKFLPLALLLFMLLSYWNIDF